MFNKLETLTLMLADADYDFDFDFYDIENGIGTITFTVDDFIYFEVGVMKYHDCYEEHCLEIINYEVDEIYDSLDEDEAFNKLEELLGNIEIEVDYE